MTNRNRESEKKIWKEPQSFCLKPRLLEPNPWDLVPGMNEPHLNPLSRGTHLASC